MTISPKRAQSVFRRLDRNLQQLSAEQNAEAVHSFRTTTRRLQTLLEELVPERTRKQKKLLKTLRGIRKQAGKIRDLDVQLAALNSLQVPLEPRRKTQLLQGLLNVREIHEKKLRKTLTKQVIRDIRGRIKRAAKDVKAETVRDPLAAAREILAGAASTDRPMTEDGLHRCRLLVKRARYATEFAPDSPAVAQFINQLKRLQDILGNWHDWLTLTQTAAERLGDVNQSPLVAVLHNVTGGKFRHAAAAIAASPALRTGPQPISAPSATIRKAGTQKAAQLFRKDSAA